MPRPRTAVALKYDSTTDSAPRVAAKGQGALADQIIRKAREAGVPVQEDPNLVAVLSRVKLDREIPPELYQSVAAILAFLYRVNRGIKPK